MGGLTSRPIVIFSALGTTIGGACVIKFAAGGQLYDSKIRADNKTIIITGANCGIGKETARELAQRGAKVIMACRDLQKCETARKDIVLKTKNKYVYCRHLDLASQDCIRRFVEQFNKEFDRLDVLINNAGVMRCPHMKTKEGIELQLGVNHMGHFLLTNLLLEKLKISAPSRIVTVSSIAHQRGTINKTDLNSEKEYKPNVAYEQSKLANVLFNLELSKRLKDTGVTANCLHPGIVDTEIFRHMSFAKSSFTGYILRPLIWPFIRTPLQGSQTTLFAALDESLEKVTGQYLVDSKIHEPSEHGKDTETAQWLWAVSEKWTRLTD
ncbi:hypothetical protein R5R35_009988 [Gryllus longicercus]|uniref:Retinol dehydrogenase 13 n=1 Tax=Gryllus longicercus TaxID=2509291 RepID=A0AAN9VQP8_9ORTH